MTVRTLHGPSTLVVACLLLGACKSASKEPEPDKPAAQAPPVTQAPADVDPAPWSKELKLDPTFAAEIEDIARHCTYVATQDVMSCPSNDLEVMRTKVPDLGLVALETLLAKVASSNPTSKNVAANQMRSAYDRSLGPVLAKATIPPRVVNALLAALEASPAVDAVRVAPAAAFVASREGRLDALTQIIERRPELRGAIQPRVMRYARMKAFDQVKKWASAQDEETVSNALEAVRLMDDWTAAEQAELGPWLEGFLTHRDARVQGKAAALLLYCGDARAKASLAWFDTALTNKRLVRDTIFAYGRRCRPDDSASLKREQLAELARSPLCAKIESRLDRVAADEASSGGLREAALQSLSSTWPQTALSRAKTLTSHSDAHLAQIAQNVITLVGGAAAK